MPEGFTTFEVADPHQTNNVVWDNLPPKEKARLNEREVWSREFEALDRRRFRIEPESFRSKFAVAVIFAIRASRIADARATQSTIRPPGLDAYCITVMGRGVSQVVQAGSAEPAVANSSNGLIFGGEPRTRVAGTDDSVRFNVWVSAQHLRRKLEVLLDGRKAESLAFRPVFDTTRGAGATIARMLDFLLVESTRSDSLLTNEIAARSFENNLAYCLLLALPHSGSERLFRQRAAAAPANVKRAEEFMRASACLPLTVEEIAGAAGCSVRALQVAFRRFRGATPMETLQRVRLEEARSQMLRTGRTESLARIAAGHGFSNPSRFAQLFRRTYGIYPSEAARMGRGGLYETADPGADEVRSPD